MTSRKGFTQYEFVFVMVVFIGIFGLMITQFNLTGAQTADLENEIELPSENASTTDKVVTYVDNTRSLVTSLSTSNPVVEIIFLAILAVFGVWIVQKMLELIPG